MNLYYALNDVVARIGLDVAVLAALTALLTGMLAVCRYRNRPATRAVKLSTWLPWLLAIVLVVLGIAEFWRMLSLLTQQHAVNREQTQLMVRSAVLASGRCLAAGAIASCWLRFLIRRLPRPSRSGSE